MQRGPQDPLPQVAVLDTKLKRALTVFVVANADRFIHF